LTNHKSFPVDAEAAARAVQAGQATAIPKAGDHLVEMVRCLRVARTTAAKARTQTANALRALVVTAPAELREQLRDLPAAQLASVAARLRPGPIQSTTAATKLALRLLGERYQALDDELARVDAELDRLTTQAAPELRQLCGVGPEIAGALLVAAGDNPLRLRSEAAFSMLCGASPIPASSGKTVRHRLNRGGTARPTPRCTGSWSSGCAGISQPATICPGGPAKDCPSSTSCAVSLGDYPDRGSWVGPWLLGERQGTASLPRRVTASFSSAAPDAPRPGDRR